MSIKGVPHERRFTVPRLRLRGKAKRIKEEKEIRDKNYQALSEKEREVHAILQTFAVEVLQNTARGESVDEAPYARVISNIYED